MSHIGRAKQQCAQLHKNLWSSCLLSHTYTSSVLLPEYWHYNQASSQKTIPRSKPVQRFQTCKDALRRKFILKSPTSSQHSIALDFGFCESTFQMQHQRNTSSPQKKKTHEKIPAPVFQGSQRHVLEKNRECFRVEFASQCAQHWNWAALVMFDQIFVKLALHYVVKEHKYGDSKQTDEESENEAVDAVCSKNPWQGHKYLKAHYGIELHFLILCWRAHTYANAIYFVKNFLSLV